MGKQTAPISNGVTAAVMDAVRSELDSTDMSISAADEIVFTSSDSSIGDPKTDFAAKLRVIQAEQQQIVRLPDGSARVNVVIEAEMMPVLEEWANGAEESFEEYLPKMISMGLQAIVNGGSVAG